ncbi:DUF2752 domain-containing protein [Myxococcota bacterium]
MLRPVGPGELDHERIWTAVFFLAVGVAIALPSQIWERLFCPFKLVVGLPCPGCGTTRMVLALLAGEPSIALSLNPLATVAALGWGVFAAYGTVVAMGRLPRVRLEGSPRVWHQRAAMMVLGLVGVNWIYLIAAGA